MRKLLIPIFLVVGVFSWISNCTGNTVRLYAHLGQSQVEGEDILYLVNPDTVISITVYKEVNGQVIDVTNSPYLTFDNVSPRKIALGNGNITILPLDAGDQLVNSSDFRTAILMITYYDEASVEYGSLTVTFKIQ